MLKRTLLRDGLSGAWLDFRQPAAVLVARSAQDVLPLLARVDEHCRQGGYAAGYVTYEAAAGVDAACSCHELPHEPLAVFGLYGPPLVSTLPGMPGLKPGREETHDPAWRLSEPYADYRAKITRIRAEIGAGNLYQASYTTRLHAEAVDAWGLFRRIGSHAAYGAFVELEDAAIVSASPELFFRLDGTLLTSIPMKGTVARGADAEEDERQRNWLLSSAKNRAENLMITDMVRNDLGRIAATGSVRAESVFELQPLPTVWQMTSRVSGTSTARLPEIFRALFPAASITGAPKVASMALIRELEESPRGIYTGAIGYVGPAKRGLTAQFNVAIRTARVDGQTKQGTYGAGGGIVWDSRAAEEYEEVRIKARILQLPESPATGLDGAELLETLGWTPESGFDHLDRHLTRLERSAAFFAVPVEAASVRRELEETVARLPREPYQRWRVRLRVTESGQVHVSCEAIELAPERVQPVMLAAEPVCRSDVYLRHKTTRRGVYERAGSGVAEGVEPLLWNDAGYVTETNIANLVYEVQGVRFTPPLSDGLLAGVLRVALLETGALRERSLPVTELACVDAIYLINSLRGWRRAELQPPSPTSSHLESRYP